MSDAQDDKNNMVLKVRVRNTFTADEDDKLREIVKSMKKLDWKSVSEKMENRTPRQCRERWNNYVDPFLHNDVWTEDEDRLLLKKYSEYGNHWMRIKNHFKGRSANSLKRRYEQLSKKPKSTKNYTSKPEELLQIERILSISNLLN